MLAKGMKALIVVGIFLIYMVSSLFGLRYFSYSSFLLPLILIGGLIFIFTGNSQEKVYKRKKPAGPVKLQYFFYVIGVIFILAAIAYFAQEFIVDLPNIVKLILLVCATVITFVVAEFMRGAEI